MIKLSNEQIFVINIYLLQNENIPLLAWEEYIRDCKKANIKPSININCFLEIKNKNQQTENKKDFDFSQIEEIEITENDINKLPNTTSEQIEEVKEIICNLKNKGYNFILKYNYLNRIILEFDNKLFSGFLFCGTKKGDWIKNFKLKNNSYENKYNLDCLHIGESVYIEGCLPNYQIIE